jgi:hypothetical protein
VLPLAVWAGGLVHAAHRGGLPGVQLGLAAAGAPTGPGSVEALAGALDDQLALELVDRADAALAQLVGEREEVLERPHRAGQAGDGEHVTRAQVGQGVV